MERNPKLSRHLVRGKRLRVYMMKQLYERDSNAEYFQLETRTYARRSSNLRTPEPRRRAFGASTAQGRLAAQITPDRCHHSCCQSRLTARQDEDIPCA